MRLKPNGFPVRKMQERVLLSIVSCRTSCRLPPQPREQAVLLVTFTCLWIPWAFLMTMKFSCDYPHQLQVQIPTLSGRFYQAQVQIPTPSGSDHVTSDTDSHDLRHRFPHPGNIFPHPQVQIPAPSGTDSYALQYRLSSPEVNHLPPSNTDFQPSAHIPVTLLGKQKTPIFRSIFLQLHTQIPLLKKQQQDIFACAFFKTNQLVKIFSTLVLICRNILQ